MGAPQYREPPATLNGNYWLGPAPYSPYSPERCHFTYRYFLDYSGGVFQDFWCHIADIAWTPSRPAPNLEYARKMTMPMHLGLISWRLGRPLRWNARREKFRGDSEANHLLSREYRKAWDWI